jgi:hypothetical protein
VTTDTVSGVAVAFAVGVAACIAQTYSYEEAVAVPGTNKLAVARSYVGPQRYEHFQHHLKQRFPQLQPDVSNGLFLRWKVDVAGHDDVRIVVGIQYRDRESRVIVEQVVRELSNVVRADLARMPSSSRDCDDRWAGSLAANDEPAEVGAASSRGKQVGRHAESVVIACTHHLDL